MSRCSGESSLARLARGVGDRARVGVAADQVGPVDAASGQAVAARAHLVAESARHRVGLAGQHRLVELQRAGLQQRSVRDHLLARLEPHGVALDNALDRHCDRLTVADHAGARGDQQCQAVELPLGAQLLEDPDRRVDHDDADEQQVGVLADGDEGDREPDQDQVEQRERVLAHDGPRRAARSLIVHRAARIEAASRLGMAQPDRVCHSCHEGQASDSDGARQMRTTTPGALAWKAEAAGAVFVLLSSRGESAGPLWCEKMMNSTSTPTTTTALEHERQDTLHRREPSVTEPVRRR